MELDLGVISLCSYTPFLVVFGFLVFICVWRFLGCEDGFSGQLDSLLATVFCACFGVSYRFSPHDLPGSMLNWIACGCESMYRLLFPSQVPLLSVRHRKAIRQIML